MKVTGGNRGHCRSGVTKVQRHLHSFVINVALLITCTAGLQADGSGRASLARGIAALHSFEYEEANDAFAEARRLEPGLVMASWGEAMSYHQTLWRNEDLQAGRDALARLGRTAAARIARTSDRKEQGYLAAVESLFGNGDATERRRRYADAMGRLYATYPDDPDVAAFYALALLGTMSRSLIGTADAHEGHSRGLAGSDTQAQVAKILERVLRAHPDHPGALHYLLHDDDDPQHAAAGLAAARRLARLAPESSHTRHMPAHIFLQLGQWHDAMTADRASFSASETWVAGKHLAPTLLNFHALAWLEYELLQLGRYREAWATLDQLAPVVKAHSGNLTLLSDLSSMRARYVVETASWPLMATESNFGNANELFAIGVSAARTGHAALGERARQALGQRAQDPREGDLRPAIAIMERELAGLLALGAGRRDESLALLQAAADAEAQLPAPLGLPAPIKPASELLGEVLTEIGRPAEALPWFEATLARNANRSASVLGLARAAAASGQADVSRRRYAELLASFDGADADLPALREARAAIGSTLPPAEALSPRRTPLALIGVTATLFAAAAITVLYVGRKKRGPVSRTPQKKSTKRVR
jgi:tetratricopeptide (TPR) repeat protein